MTAPTPPASVQERIMQDDAITFSDLTIEFATPEGNTKTVISDLNLSIPRGQFVALIGRSGCGKTTLLNLVAGLVEPTEGDANILGAPPKKARKRLGFMMARDALFPWRTARKNVEYGLELRGTDRTQRRLASDRWLAAVGMSDAKELWPWQLSQGMRQRVALARTWALDPEILLMDEPFAALDAHTRVSVQSEFLALWQGMEGRTVVFVTHDLTEAVSLADRVVLLGEGRILDDVTVDFERPRDLESIRTDPAFIEIYDRLLTRLNH
ncbi:ABC transporter ATP-binding protein [Rhodococcus sp. IEGM 1318]|uniref:ABC transporter ATP-binding protein n=1 Tax=Rhodococcus sp. IEGM 1318 TaxID=3082226 RepID=UPI002952F86B|nr:ABC transporter ATP-binding protein [Rhodococcus sp. IEGM 1318]MDV8009372.1 ABC transporter ATP-binding protein [Rhodococcus sp. IEGM 1318]